MPILNSISSFFDDLTTSRRHAAKKRPVRSGSPSRLPFYTNGHPQSSSTNNLTPALAPAVPPRQASWEAPSPSLRSSSITALRIPSSAFIPLDTRKSQNGIQLQELSPNGVQPPPPVVDSWARIDAWAESHYPELYDQLSYPATPQDVDDLEAELDCTLPMDVRQSLYVHDGQDRGGKPTGILFGVTLLDCEEIVEEWQLWKKVAEAYAQEATIINVMSNSTTTADQPSSARDARRQSKLFGQTSRFANSRPPDTIQKVYAHPAWIPLAKDFSGNNIAVDLCPGQKGTWGQIILFGRDCDTKYVVARSWAAFLAAIADDFEAGEARFDGDEVSRESFRGAELRIRSCYGAKDDTFMEVLKARVRLREREIRRRREAVNRKQNGEAKTNGDLIAASPIVAGDGIPSPNLPRGSDSVASSPVVGSPKITTPVTAHRRESVTVSGPKILAREQEELKKRPNKLVSCGVVIHEEQIIESPVPESPVLVEKPGDSTEEGSAATGFGIKDGVVIGKENSG